MKGIAETPSIEERLRVITYAMTSRTLLLKVLDDLGSSLSQDRMEDLVESLQKNTKITMKETMKETDLFVVSFQGRDPKFAMNYVNALVRRYIEENISEKREETFAPTGFSMSRSPFSRKGWTRPMIRLSISGRRKGSLLSWMTAKWSKS